MKKKPLTTRRLSAQTLNRRPLPRRPESPREEVGSAVPESAETPAQAPQPVVASTPTVTPVASPTPVQAAPQATIEQSTPGPSREIPLVPYAPVRVGDQVRFAYQGRTAYGYVSAVAEDRVKVRRIGLDAGKPPAMVSRELVSRVPGQLNPDVVAVAARVKR